jgi:3-mercaptopyruvate sulfurtransferase SseA
VPHEAAFTEAGVDLDKQMITTCGSGMTAAVVLVWRAPDRQERRRAL